MFARLFEEQYKETLAPAALPNEAVRAYNQYLLNQKAKPKTINRRLASIAAYAHFLEQAGHVENLRNPMQGVKAVRQAELAPRWLDKKQRAALLRAVDKEVENAMRRYPRLRMIYLRDAAIVKLILFAGLRVGEIVQLRLSDVVLDERKGSVVVREGKGTKRREIPLNAKARNALIEYLRLRPNVNNDFLLLGQRNEGVQSKTVQRAVQRFVKVTDLEEVTPHVLHHTFAKSLVDNGVCLDKIAIMLGHSSLDTTQIYTTPGIQDLENAINDL